MFPQKKASFFLSEKNILNHQLSYASLKSSKYYKICKKNRRNLKRSQLTLHTITETKIKQNGRYIVGS